MKKKFLSLMMAAAVVATTSVSAFAADTTINGLDNVEHKAQISITGDVQDESGQVKPGNLNVTVPTAASFTVNKNNSVESATINITNSGSQDIDVFAYKFTDVSQGEKINVVRTSGLERQNRTNVSLSLRGDLGIVYLGSKPGDSQSGIYSVPDFEDSNAINTDTTPYKLANVAPGSKGKLFLEGTAGNTGNVAEAVKDNFTLILKIKKGTKQ